MGIFNQPVKDKKVLSVLHIAPTPFFSDRGCHMRIRGIIFALKKYPIVNILCTYNLGRDVEGIETVRTASIPGYTKLEAGPSAFKYVADILLFFKVFGQIFSRRPDIIHAHLHEGALIGWLAKSFFFWRKIPMIFDMQGSLVGELEAHGYFTKYHSLKRIFWGLEYLITRMANHFICSSQNSVDILINEFKVRAESVELVNDGADDFSINDNYPLQEKLGLPKDGAIVIYSGALLEAKGFSHLCNAILLAKKRDIPCHFLVVGYPEQIIHDFIKNNQLEAYCTIAGRVPYEQLGSYLALADIALEPKLSDSGEASGKILNYMGAGLPVVCFDNTSNRQLLGQWGFFANDSLHEGAGIFENALIDQIANIISDPDKGMKAGAEGKKRVTDNFSWLAAGEKIQSVYHLCLID